MPEPDFAARFTAEIRTLASFDHPNIAQLRTAFQVDGQQLMVMEFVEGSTAAQLASDRLLLRIRSRLDSQAFAIQRYTQNTAIKAAKIWRRGRRPPRT